MREALKVSRQGYHAWRRRPPSAHDLRDAELTTKISEIYAASRGAYGAPEVLAELKKAGERTSRKRAARIMREEGLPGTTRGCARGRGAGRGRPRRRRAPHRTWSAAISARTRRTGPGSPTSPASARTRGGSTPPWSWTCGRPGSSDGRCPRA